MRWNFAASSQIILPIFLNLIIRFYSLLRFMSTIFQTFLIITRTTMPTMTTVRQILPIPCSLTSFVIYVLFRSRYFCAWIFQFSVFLRRCWRLRLLINNSRRWRREPAATDDVLECGLGDDDVVTVMQRAQRNARRSSSSSGGGGGGGRRRNSSRCCGQQSVLGGTPDHRGIITMTRSTSWDFERRRCFYRDVVIASS